MHSEVRKRSAECLVRSFADENYANFCDAYYKLKTSQTLNYVGRLQSGDNTWTTLKEIPANKLKDIFKDEDSIKVYEKIVENAEYDRLCQQMKIVAKDTEPHQLNKILLQLVESGRKLENVEYIHLHTSYSPCNVCNQTIEKFVQTFNIRIYVTYETGYYKESKRVKHFHSDCLKHQTSAVHMKKIKNAVGGEGNKTACVLHYKPKS